MWERGETKRGISPIELKGEEHSRTRELCKSTTLQVIWKYTFSWGPRRVLPLEVPKDEVESHIKEEDFSVK